LAAGLTVETAVGCLQGILISAPILRSLRSGESELWADPCYGELELFDGLLSTVISNSVSVNSNNVAASGAGIIPHLALTPIPATGFFTGSFHDPITAKTVTFQGALLQGSNSGFGYFTESNHPGSVIIGNSTPANPVSSDI
jgi:hypothetical protein